MTWKHQTESMLWEILRILMTYFPGNYSVYYNHFLSAFPVGMTWFQWTSPSRIVVGWLARSLCQTVLLPSNTILLPSLLLETLNLYYTFHNFCICHIISRSVTEARCQTINLVCWVKQSVIPAIMKLFSTSKHRYSKHPSISFVYR